MMNIDVGKCAVGSQVIIWRCFGFILYMYITTTKR